MKKILIRAPSDPTSYINPIKAVACNDFGTNTGNLIFVTSLMRILMVDESVHIDTIETNIHFTKEDAKEINKKYDAFIIPLANAFRRSFTKDFDYLTELIKMLNIPCVVVGVGIQESLKCKTFNKKRSFDEHVKQFMDAVLEKSEIVGVRGGCTAKYLENLGYIQEKDFTVIGCPSMYMYGAKLPEIIKKPLNKDSLISFNTKLRVDKKFHTYLSSQIKETENYRIVIQNVPEIAAFCADADIDVSDVDYIPDYYPLGNGRGHNDRAIAFANPQKWFEYFRSCTFSFGSRIHGSIAAILSGTPCYIIITDSRIKELAQYHRIPGVLIDDFDGDRSVRQIYNETDFSCIYEGHRERFLHFVEFLEKNGIEHIFKNDESPVNTAFDKIISNVNFGAAIERKEGIIRKIQYKIFRIYFLNLRSLGHLFSCNKDIFKIYKSPIKHLKRSFLVLKKYLLILTNKKLDEKSKIKLKPNKNTSE